MSKLSLIDYASLGPLFILLCGALLLILVESFSDFLAKRFSALIMGLTLLAAFAAELYAPVSQNPLLTRWILSDSVSHFFTLFFISTALATTLLSESFFNRFKATQGEYYFLLLAATAGLILIGKSADFLTLFIGLETLSLSLYILCCYMKSWDNAAEGALKYFLLGAISVAFLLYGIALIYGAIGTTDLSALSEGFRSLDVKADRMLFLAGIAFITLGLSFKAALVPFHTWAPDVYESSSTPITAFMSVGTKAGAFAAFIRIFVVALPHFDPRWYQAMALIAILTLLYSNLVALKQVQLRRFFAYSGISHAGFLLIPLAAGTAGALNALLFYLVIYGLATIGAFAVLCYLDKTQEGVSLANLKGLFGHSPFLAVTLAICLLTLAGIPPTAGFIAKFYIFKVAFEAQLYLLILVGLLTAILSAYYYLRIISFMFTDQSEIQPQPQRSVSLFSLAGFILVAIIIFSLYPPLLNL